MSVTTISRSSELFIKAQHYMPGGVNSPVRAFKAVKGEPPFFASASGAYLIDVDGKRYIDFIGSWGAMIVGHAHPKVVQAVQEKVMHGLSFGAPCELEVRLAEMICQLMPNIQKVRLVNSGTEATMTAIRLSRGFTGRNKIIKFEGCYHGHSDSLLVKAGSGALTFGQPSSPGVSTGTANDTLVATFNDLNSVTQLFENNHDEIAAIIIEPIAGNMNLILPKPEFLKGLRELCDQYGALLIFDEVMTGFRVALGGAQSIYKIIPDLTTLGKVIGGGMPVGAVGGKKEIMDFLAPLGPVYQAGTLSGNPITMAAGIATLTTLLQQPDFYSKLTETTHKLVRGLIEVAQKNKIEFTANSVGGMFGIYFSEEKTIDTYQQVTRCRLEQFNQFFHGMLREGIYFAPSAFEAGFVSSAHSQNEINATLETAEKIFSR